MAVEVGVGVVVGVVAGISAYAFMKSCPMLAGV